ncbi:RDD family protein [Flavobacterium sp. MXW15]|uniref:RDD family protein n=1 Tax=Xanthomonas chitinilytica TaxID=2989819 RepID=A0ABT3JSU4_9XANT|nr:RDD family protein [Xanthomonas sp. H13-6]MCW4454260.1 RDD family protein [Flavobacterium sp. MXW15]MCW4471493.1 RDD family protein [Xanthomonas sp. H13-6]
MGTTDPAPKKNRPLLLWRLLALLYDLWPALALWMLVASLFVAGYTLAGHGARENIAPFSALQWLLWLCCWAITGLYATVSWRRGGQTLGMRPWRLRLTGTGDGAPSWAALWKRYLMGTLSLLCGGLGFWWALFDRERLTLHDRLSRTRLVRLPKSG